MKIVTWNTPEEAQKELYKRLGQSMDERRDRQYQWETNERIIYNSKGGNSVMSSNISLSFDSDVTGAAGPDQSNASIGTNYLFKNLRFIHAQLSANPPSVIPRPTSNDPEDRRRADAADRLIRFALRQYAMQEHVDKASLNCLLYGTAYMKTMWDQDAGDPLALDEETGELTMEGDFIITVPNTWDVFPDSDATCWEDVRYVFERIYMPYEEACFRFPDKKEMLEKYRIEGGQRRQAFDKGSSSSIDHNYYDSVELFQYWEKGLPVNGFMGRFCFCTRNGEPLTDMAPNPERYAPPAVGGNKPIAKAVLPFHLFTDIDVPNSFWGKSFVEFGAPLQDNLNRLDSTTLDIVQAHGVARVILPEGAEIADDSITNSPWDIIKMTGSVPPHFMEPMPLPPAMSQIRDTMKMGIDDTSGVNEAMFGQQSREQSGFSMQYATNQGNMIRRRLFNKYVLFVESIYKRFLLVVQKNWDIPRTVHVLGAEKAFEATDIKGADIASGYDLVVEYGASLSLDPTTRRDEILTLMPLFEKAGVETREILGMLKLNELSGMYDQVQLAQDRQREIFEEMIKTGLYIMPEELQDHKNMLSYAYVYVMTTEFKYLEEDQKVLVRRHIREREALAATQAAGAGALGGMAPGPAPQGPNGEAPAQPGPDGPVVPAMIPS